MIIALVYVAAAAIALASLGLGLYALNGIRSRDEETLRHHVGRAALSAVAGLAAAVALVLLFT